MPRSWGTRNSRGLGLPSDASAEIDPTSMWPKPNAASNGTARALLSKPAARPKGVRKRTPAISTPRRSLFVTCSRSTPEHSQHDELAISAARMARPCTVSASARNSSGRSSGRYRFMARLSRSPWPFRHSVGAYNLPFAPRRSRKRFMQLSPSLFKAYDIRGVVPSALNEEVAHALGHAFGRVAQAEGEKVVAVGRDGRLSGPTLSAALVRGLVASGVDVIDIGP